MLWRMPKTSRKLLKMSPDMVGHIGLRSVFHLIREADILKHA